MTSKAERRRRKAGLPELKVKPGPSHPLDRRHTHQAEDATQAVLTARCHHLGKPPTRDERAKVNAPWLCCELGLAMQYAHGSDACARMWSVYQQYRTTLTRYHSVILGRTMTAQGATITMLPERVEATEHHTVDDRTPPERQNDIVRSYMRWQGYLGHMTANDRSLIANAEDATLWADMAPTTRGAQTVEALARLAKVVERVW
jgi:hypothetical protein